MKSNSFLHPRAKLNFANYRPEDVKGAIDVTETTAWERIDAVLGLKDEDRTFENTVLGITRSAEEFYSIANLVWHLESVLGDLWNDASSLVTERTTEFANKVSFDQRIYRAFVDVRDNRRGKTELTAARQKLLDEEILSFERNGIALPKAQQEELKEARSILSKAQLEYGRNAVEASDAAGLEIADKAELSGMTDEFIDKCRQAAQAAGKTGYWIAYSQPVYANLMASCSVRETRHRFNAVQRRLADTTNEPLMRTILKQRRRMATILGYHDYSDYVLEQRMAKNGQTAAAFIADIATKYRPAATEEFTQLVVYARELEHDPKLELEAGDTGGGSYYSKMLKAKEVGIDEEELKAYFGLDQVLDEMFSTIKTLYGVSLKRVEKPGWHGDVQVYEVHDGDKHLATAWCDWYARKGKRGGAWFNQFYVADKTEANSGESNLGCVVANFDEPNNEGKSRLTPRDVETIWHEFGHFMHFALGNIELAEQSSLATRWDFVEAPSQIMENWVWQPEVLNRMARHEKTGDPLSPEIVERLLKARRFQAGLNAMGQSTLATIDLRLHRDYDVDGKVSVEEYARLVKKEFAFVPVKPDDAMVATFLHIFGGGYGSGYYSYKWAEVIEADFFAHFMKEGYLSPKVGNDYRRKVLAPGSSIEPDVLVRAFLGRDATVDALLERDGIISALDSK